MSDEAAGPPRCLMCRYELTGLAAGKCPECGWEIDARHVQLTEAQASVRRAEMRVERLWSELQKPAEPSSGRRILDAYATIMGVLVVGAIVVVGYLALRGLMHAGPGR